MKYCIIVGFLFQPSKKGKYTMKNEMKIFNNEEFGAVRTVVIDGVPWFVGKDVAMALGYKDTNQAIRKHVEDEDKLTRQIDGEGQRRNMIILNESGLYAMIFGSELVSAKKFKRWVTSEVLPSIRENGTYIKQLSPENIPVGEVASLSKVMDRIMVRQNSKPHEIAQAFNILCKQFSIQLPENFVKVPEYEQLSLVTVDANQITMLR